MGKLNPNIKDAFDYATSLHASGKVERALFVYRQILSSCPECTDILLNVGTALHDLERYPEAVDVYNIAIKINPQWWQAYYNLGNTLMSMSRYHEAIASYGKCNGINPDHIDAFVTKGTALEAIGQYNEAMEVYDYAISRKQDCAEAHWNRALALLRQGNFVEGWREYEWRWLKKGYTTTQRIWKCPKWDGRQLDGETILIHAEQAFGDIIQFIRYVPLVAARGGKVIVECPSPMVSLLSGVEGVWKVIPSEAELHADYHFPLLSLPMVFGTTLDTIPSSVPYLITCPERKMYWQNRIIHDGTFRVGVVWAGRKTPDPHRTCGQKVLQPLSDVQGVTYYSLQVEETDKARNAPDNRFALKDFTKEINDFADSAALIENLDLVITIDTAVAHLAGALGKKTFLMVPYASDWRWMLGREDSPWYPTMRIFRQNRPRDWEGVIVEVKACLVDMLVQHASCRPRNNSGL